MPSCSIVSISRAARVNPTPVSYTHLSNTILSFIGSKTDSSAMINSTAPKDDAKCPPFFVTTSITVSYTHLKLILKLPVF